MTKSKIFEFLQIPATIIGICTIITILFFVFTKINIPTFQKTNVQTPTAAYTQEEVPELKEILGPIQKIRLEAARKLVERVGVEQALEILEHSDLPHTGEGHLVVHQVGFYAYQHYGLESILHCKDYFLQACYHGAIIEAASKGGFDEIAKMADTCKPGGPVRYFQCNHAAGHAILAIWNYDLESSLKTCDDLFEKETSTYPEALTSCHNGAFMENLFGVHDWGTEKSPKLDWISDKDPYFPCNAFDGKYQKGCWLNQAARIYQMEGGDIVKTARLCEQIKNNQYVTWCIDNLARQIHALTNGQAQQVFNMCSAIGQYWKENCIVINAGSFYSVGDFKTSLSICQQIAPIAQNQCFEQLKSQIVGDNVESKIKKDRCSQIGGNYAKNCLSQI